MQKVRGARESTSGKNIFIYLGRKERILIISLELSQVEVFVCDKVVAIVSVDGNPVTSSINDNVLWQGTISHPPHVILTLHKGPVQTLLLNKPALGAEGKQQRSRAETSTPHKQTDGPQFLKKKLDFTVHNAISSHHITSN